MFDLFAGLQNVIGQVTRTVTSGAKQVASSATAAQQAAQRQATQIASQAQAVAARQTQQVQQLAVRQVQQAQRQAGNARSAVLGTSQVMHPLTGQKVAVPRVAKAAYSVPEFLFGMGRGTDIHDDTENPIGKALVRFGQSDTAKPYVKPVERSFMDNVWAPKLAAETAIGARVRATNNPELIGAMEAAKFVHSDVFNLDTPTGFGIEASQALTGVGGGRAVLKTAAGGTEMLSGILKGIGKLADAIPAAKKAGTAARTAARATSKIDDAAVAARAARAGQNAQAAARARQTANVMNSRKAALAKQSADLRAAAQARRINTARVTSKALDKTSAVTAVPRASIMNTRAAMNASKATRPLAMVADEGKSLSKVTTRLDELTDVLRTQKLDSGAAKTTSIWEKFRNTAITAGVGAGLGIGGLTLAGVFDEQPKTIKDAFPEGKIPEQYLDPSAGLSGGDGSEWWDLPGGTSAMQPDPFSIGDYPPGVQGTLGDGGYIGYDEEGNPESLIGPDGSILRELTDEEKEAIAMLTEGNKPLMMRLSRALGDNWQYIALAGILVVGGVVYYKYYYKPNARSMKTYYHKSTGGKQTWI